VLVREIILFYFSIPTPCNDVVVVQDGDAYIFCMFLKFESKKQKKVDGSFLKG
jgi:hypothetical protein